MVDSQTPRSSQPTDAPSASAVIEEIYHVHLEEFQFLWTQRKEAMQSSDYFANDIRQLEKRVDAHLDGLLIPGPAAIPVLRDHLMDAEGPEAAFAASWVLMRIDIQAATDVVMEVYLEANEIQLEGICQALCHVSLDSMVEKLEKAFVEATPAIAVVAGEVLAFHQQLDLSGAGRIADLLVDESPWVRRHAWRVVALVGHMPTKSVD